MSQPVSIIRDNFAEAGHILGSGLTKKIAVLS